DHLILTAIGPDQVGLVQKISEFISRHGCNIEDSKMAVFCGEFAVIVLISGDGGSLVKIARDYRDIEAETGLSITIKTPSARRTQRHKGTKTQRKRNKNFFDAAFLCVLVPLCLCVLPRT